MSHNVLSETKTKTKIKLSSLEFQAQNEKKKSIMIFQTIDQLNSMKQSAK